MHTRPDDCYAALRGRDRRFDGVFFVAVRSTHIYCRPICPARTPRRDRCRFFATAATAEAAGFRPCLRCRPELAPGHAPIDATTQSAWTAIARLRAEATRGIERGHGGLSGAGGAVRAVASQLRVGERHLRRLVQRELGVTPIELLQTSRLLAAKQLLTETRLPVTTVAYASGFASLRRFNALFVARYRLAPSALRRSAITRIRGAASRDNSILHLTLAYRPPIAWSQLLEFLRGHRIPGVEAVSANGYARTVAIGGLRGWIRVTHDATRHRLCVEIAESLAPAAAAVLVRVRSLFDLDARPDVIDSHLSGDPRLAQQIRQTPGLRVPGAFDGFELAWRTILGQQVSVRAATTVSGRVAAAFGEPTTGDFGVVGGMDGIGALARFTPSIERLARATEEEFQCVGLTRSRARTLRAFAALMQAGGIPLEPGVPVTTIAPALRESYGIGPWTVDYLAMRALRWPDAFPSTDLVLAREIGARRSADIDRITAPWRPWRAYAAMHLWNESKGSP